jgi:hypothetical protein
VRRSSMATSALPSAPALAPAPAPAPAQLRGGAARE